MIEKPKLRAVEALPVDMEGERAICLRDNSGLTPNMLAISPITFFLAALCDGEHTVADMAAAFEERFGQAAEPEHIEQLIRQLDESLFLEGPRFEAHKQQVFVEFQASSTRKATHAGQAYPHKVDELRETLDGFFEPPDGPGAADRHAECDDVVAIAAPHIDLARGGSCYAHAYKRLVEGSRARTFVILGTLHQFASCPFIVTDKDFETPLGPVECDRDFTRDLIDRAILPPTVDELAHLNEHSVEFQALFLKHLYGASRPARIVPILCGPLLPPGGNGDPMDVPGVERFITALRDMIHERGNDVAVIASVDLSHVGKRFGDEVEINDEMLSSLETLDRKLLTHAEAMDPAGFYAQNQGQGDRTRVCGLSALYTVLSTVDAQRGRLIEYAQAPEEATQSVVSFAAMAFERD